MADPIIDLDREVNDLVARLTLDEKITLLAGRNTWETWPVERLGIPSLKVCFRPSTHATTLLTLCT
jgi:beta-glucosidase